MRDLTLALVQQELVWENPQANRERLTQALHHLEHADVIVLPEMFSTGFSMNPAALAEGPDGPSLAWMAEQARQHQAAVCGSLMTVEGGRFFNRLYWVEPEGRVLHYDKRHLFRLAGEDKVYTPGTSRLVLQWREWTIQPMICYDLRFPVWSRNTQAADLMLYTANWPVRRATPWKVLLQARAIENVCWVAGVNRVGTDGNGEQYHGDSVLHDPLGQPVLHAGDQPGVFTFVLPGDAVSETRARFAFLDDRDSFTLHV
jgi:predicted amidohydrolase